jgi:hypothetical protein
MEVKLALRHVQLSATLSVFEIIKEGFLCVLYLENSFADFN